LHSAADMETDEVVDSAAAAGAGGCSAEALAEAQALAAVVGSAQVGAAHSGQVLRPNRAGDGLRIRRRERRARQPCPAGKEAD
jgi:hypothetical protein